MKQPLRTALLLAVTCSLRWHSASARSAFASLIPNGNGPLGHAGGVAGGPLNAFGEAFEAAGRQWTPALCQLDSDGDGATNGEELGDPCCRWTAGSAPLWTTVVTHPGEADAFTSTQLAAMKCAEAQDVPVSGVAMLEPEEAGSVIGSASRSVDGDVSWPDVGATPRPRHREPAATPTDDAMPAKSNAGSRFAPVVVELVALVATVLTVV